MGFGVACETPLHNRLDSLVLQYVSMQASGWGNTPHPFNLHYQDQSLLEALCSKILMLQMEQEYHFRDYLWNHLSFYLGFYTALYDE